MRNRPGLSIVEVLVALLVVSLGLLALAGSSALTIRVAGAASRERRAAERAASRVAWLSAAGCAAARDGSLDDEAAAVREQWTVRPPAGGLAELSVQVTWPSPGGARTMTLSSAMSC